MSTLKVKNVVVCKEVRYTGHPDFKGRNIRNDWWRLWVVTSKGTFVHSMVTQEPKKAAIQCERLRELGTINTKAVDAAGKAVWINFQASVSFI